MAKIKNLINIFFPFLLALSLYTNSNDFWQRISPKLEQYLDSKYRKEHPVKPIKGYIELENGIKVYKLFHFNPKNLEKGVITVGVFYDK